jgi:hypothetical protein
MRDIVERIKAYLKHAASRHYGPVADVNQAYQALALFLIEEDRDFVLACQEIPLSTEEQAILKSIITGLSEEPVEECA